MHALTMMKSLSSYVLLGYYNEPLQCLASPLTLRIKSQKIRLSDYIESPLRCLQQKKKGNIISLT